MGVTAGRFTARAGNSFWEEAKKRMEGILKGFAAFAENYGLTVGERECWLRREAPGKQMLTSLEDYGVAVCNMGTKFWKADE
ncbi:MAG: hypothetical protein K6T29_00330 [Peptococcaceae bacterium]|nr:hypothetical protein [Peptococcaceae bacterium]